MSSEQQQRVQGLTDSWKEPWTPSTWGTWSSQNQAAQGIQPSSWMYTSHAAQPDASDSMDFDFGSFSSEGTSFSASSSIPSPVSPSTAALRQHQRWPSSNSNMSGPLAEHHHHHHHHHHHVTPSLGTTSPPPSSAVPVTPPPGFLSPQRFGQSGAVGHHAAHSLLAPRALGARIGTSRSSSVESESSLSGMFGSSGGGGGGGGGTCAFQIAGYRTVELLPTAPQRQTLQKWFGVVRWTHNRAVDALRVDPTASAAALRAAVAEAEAEHEWAAAVPLAIRDATVAQLVGALHLAQRSAEVAAAATGESVMAEPIGTAAQNKGLKYRTRKDRLEQVVLRADGFQFGIPYPEYFGYAPLACSAPIPDRLQTDAILVRSTDRFYLCIPDTC